MAFLPPRWGSRETRPFAVSFSRGYRSPILQYIGITILRATTNYTHPKSNTRKKNCIGGSVMFNLVGNNFLHSSNWCAVLIPQRVTHCALTNSIMSADSIPFWFWTEKWFAHTPLHNTPLSITTRLRLYYFTGIYVRTTADSLLKSTSTPDGVKAVTGRHAAKQPGHAQVYGEAADPCEALTSKRLEEALPRL